MDLKNSGVHLVSFIHGHIGFTHSSEIDTVIIIQNHTIVWIGRDLKYLIHHGQACLPLNQAVQGSIQLGIELFQGWGFSEKSVPGPHHHHSKELLPAI